MELTREELLELVGHVHRVDAMLLSDTPGDNPVDAIFFHARSHGDYDHLFELVTIFYRVWGGILPIGINGGDGSHRGGELTGEAWPGGYYWFTELVARGVKGEHIKWMETAFHTKAENDGFLKMAIHFGWRSAVIVSHPHQQIRAHLGFVKSMEVGNYWMRVYPLFPRPEPSASWWKEVYAPSAMLTPDMLPPPDQRMRPRFDLMPGEVLKIPEYQKKGDLASFEDFYAYWRRRDSIR